MIREGHGISETRLLFLDSTKVTSKLSIIAPLWGESTGKSSSLSLLLLLSLLSSLLKAYSIINVCGPLYHTIWWDLAIMMWQIVAFKNIQLEQLECLRPEIPSAAPWLPILVIHNFTSDPKSKQDKVKVKFWHFARNFTCDTPSQVAW